MSLQTINTTTLDARAGRFTLKMIPLNFMKMLITIIGLQINEKYQATMSSLKAVSKGVFTHTRGDAVRRTRVQESKYNKRGKAAPRGT